MTDKKSNVGDGIKKARSQWSFADGVAKSFPSHVKRSIPLYDEGHQLICGLSEFFCSKNSLCYDLGTSTGTLLAKLAKHHHDRKDIRWVGLDVEPEMIEQAKSIHAGNQNMEFQVANLLEFDFQPSNYCVLYYTLHFLSVSERAQLLKKIYKALEPGGALVIFEKVLADNSRFQDYQTKLYEDFKLSNDFSIEEIHQKTRSLNAVLQPLSRNENISMFEKSGFSSVNTVCKYLGFEGFLAVK